MLTRRQFLKASAISTSLFTLPHRVIAASRQPLFIPPLMEGHYGRPILLSAQSTQFSFLENKVVEGWGFNGAYLGPTVRVRQGDYAKLIYRNSLEQPLAINIQGLQVAGELFSGLRNTLQHDQSWSPIMQIRQSAATCWYHASTIARSAYQTYRGLCGLWIIEDDESRKSMLPQKYGVNDIPLILQDMTLNNSGTQLYPEDNPYFLGERVFVNGQESPYLNVPRGWVRLRLLNASLSRTYQLQFSDQRPFLLIARELGFLSQGQQLTQLFLAPNERAEILVNLNEGDNVTLIDGTRRNFLDKISQFFESDNRLFDNTILELRPEGLASAFNKENVYQFSGVGMLPNVSKERHFYLDPNNFMINQHRFDPRRIDVAAKLGSVERWVITISNATGFTIQGAKFIVESINDVPVNPTMLSWRDTVWVEGKVTILVKFDNPSSSNYPFTFGAASLMLVDKGCFGLLLVQ